MGITSIQWTDRTWNPVRGCTRVSEGCRNCYAEKVAARFSDEGSPFHLYAKRTKAGARWTGKVELVESHLGDPLRWKKPQRVFVNSMSDLFHEGLDDEAISAVFAVMSQSPIHTFQILTKRPRRMFDWFSRTFVTDGIEEAGVTRFSWCHANTDGRWPLPNVWLGVSVEDQKTANERIPLLLKTPAAVQFVSYEPALGPVDFDAYQKLDWIIVGGESGPGARPFDVGWARNTIAQCKAAGVACFVKQLGADPREENDPNGKYPAFHHKLKLRDKKGGDWREWPTALRVRELPK